MVFKPNNPGCCECGTACVAPTLCQCLGGNEGPVNDISDVDVTISDSWTAVDPLVCGGSAGDFGYDFSGTYSLSCGGGSFSYETGPTVTVMCTSVSGSPPDTCRDYYFFETLNITLTRTTIPFPTQDVWRLIVLFTAGVADYVPCGDPPTLGPGFGPGSTTYSSTEFRFEMDDDKFTCDGSDYSACPDFDDLTAVSGYPTHSNSGSSLYIPYVDHSAATVSAEAG